MGSVVLLKQCTDFLNVAGFADEGSGDKIDVLFDPKNDIIGVFFRNARQGNSNSRYVYTLFALDRSAVNNAGLDFSALNVNNGKSDKAVVDQDGRSYLNIIRKVGVSDGDTVLVTKDFFRSQCQILVLNQFNRFYFQLACANLRSFCIEQDSNSFVQFLRCLTDCINPSTMLFKIAVGEIQTGHIHTSQNQFFDILQRFTRRSDRTYNFTFPH
ncbi:hypothetical protein D3C76_1226120 [compost metagenome]